MAQIIFGGRAYNSELEMPADILQAYKEGRDKTGTKQSSQLIDIPWSAPQNTKLASSGESVYQASSPGMDSAVPLIEPESSIGTSILVSGTLWTLMVLAIIFLVTLLLW